MQLLFNDRIVVIGDNVNKELSSKSNLCQSCKCRLQTSSVTLCTTGHKCGLQISSVTLNTTGLANIDVE